MPRSSTVYDLTSLQIHSDGRRVKQAKDNRPISLVSQTPSYWVAKDAGGLPTKLSRSKGSATGNKKRKRSNAGPERRTIKKRKYELDMNYLDAEKGLVASTSSAAWKDFPSSVCPTAYDRLAVMLIIMLGSIKEHTLLYISVLFISRTVIQSRSPDTQGSI